MNAVPSLMSSVRPCPSCDQDESVVNYWEHSGVKSNLGVSIVRYQCQNCSEQTTDMSRSEPNTMDQVVNVMSDYIEVDPDEYRERLADDYYYDGSELVGV